MNMVTFFEGEQASKTKIYPSLEKETPVFTLKD